MLESGATNNLREELSRSSSILLLLKKIVGSWNNRLTRIESLLGGEQSGNKWIFHRLVGYDY